MKDANSVHIHAMLSEIGERLTRMESRLVQFMIKSGVDPYAGKDHGKHRQDVRESPNGADHRKEVKRHKPYRSV